MACLGLPHAELQEGTSEQQAGDPSTHLGA
jgi:hypothetical protein